MPLYTVIGDGLHARGCFPSAVIFLGVNDAGNIFDGRQSGSTMRLLILVCLSLAPVIPAFVPPPPLVRTVGHVSRAQTSMAVTLTPGVGTETLILPMMDETRLKIRLDPDAFKDLALKTNALLASFRTIREAAAAADKEGKKGPVHLEPAMLFKTEQSGHTLEMESNPNLFPDPWHATVFVVVKSHAVEVSSECQLSALVDSLKLYKATYKIKMEEGASEN